MKDRMLAQVLTLGLALAAIGGAPAAIAGGATVVKLEGSAAVERKGTRVPLAVAMPVYSGDTLAVAEQAVAQLRFEDDSVFVVPGAAKLRVDTFTMPAAGAPGKAVYTLVEGGLRTITGRVSKGGKDQYEMRAEEATITVAGSAYLAIRCQAECARKYKAGLYVRGESGVVTVANSAGKLRLQRRQTGYAASNSTVPQPVKVSPFDDPLIAAAYGIAAEFDTEVHPPRIEQEASASPS